MNIVDGIIVLAAIPAVIIGWRVGLLQGLLGFAGFLGGVAAVLWLLPQVAPQWVPAGSAATVILVALVLACGMLGQTLGTLLGGWLRNKLGRIGGDRFDSALGAGLGLVAVVVAAWAFGILAQSLPQNATTAPVSQSRVLAAVDARMPSQARSALNGLAGVVHDSTLPVVVGGLLGPERVAKPPQTANLSPAAAEAVNSVVRVSGNRPSCGAGATGSGYVSTPEHVTTNAHVVAAMTEPRVSTSDGRSYKATVVGFDPGLDVAVLYVPGLPLPAIPTSTEDAPGTTGVVVGYPGGGALQISPAVVNSTVGSGRALGTDIYGTPGVVRDALVIGADVRPGNSGGPLIANDGTVIGLVFAQALENDQVGYALTAEQFRQVSRAFGQSTAAVSTGACPSG